MPEYLITTDEFMGFSHDGEMIEEEGEAYLELTSQEVDALKELAKKKGSTDVEVLDLRNHSSMALCYFGDKT